MNIIDGYVEGFDYLHDQGEYPTEEKMVEYLDDLNKLMLELENHPNTGELVEGYDRISDQLYELLSDYTSEEIWNEIQIRTRN